MTLPSVLIGNGEGRTAKQLRGALATKITNGAGGEPTPGGSATGSGASGGGVAGSLTVDFHAGLSGELSAPWPSTRAPLETDAERYVDATGMQSAYAHARVTGSPGASAVAAVEGWDETASAWKPLDDDAGPVVSFGSAGRQRGDAVNLAAWARRPLWIRPVGSGGDDTTPATWRHFGVTFRPLRLPTPSAPAPAACNHTIGAGAFQFDGFCDATLADFTARTDSTDPATFVNVGDPTNYGYGYTFGTESAWAWVDDPYNGGKKALETYIPPGGTWGAGDTSVSIQASDYHAIELGDDAETDYTRQQVALRATYRFEGSAIWDEMTLAQVSAYWSDEWGIWWGPDGGTVGDRSLQTYTLRAHGRGLPIGLVDSNKLGITYADVIAAGGLLDVIVEVIGDGGTGVTVNFFAQPGGFAAGGLYAARKTLVTTVSNAAHPFRFESMLLDEALGSPGQASPLGTRVRRLQWGLGPSAAALIG